MIFVRHCLIFKKCIMKKFIILIFVYFLSQIGVVNAQAIRIVTPGNYYEDFGITDDVPNVFFDDGEIIVKNTLGSPLFYSDWMKCSVKFFDGTENSLSNVNYDAANDHFIMYIKNYTDEFSKYATRDFPLVMLDDSSILQIILLDKKNKHKYVHISENNFYTEPRSKFFEFFADQIKDAYLLKNNHKEIRTNRSKSISTLQGDWKKNKYYNSSQYYIKNKDGIFVKTDLKKSKIFQALHDPANRKDLKEFVKKNKLKLKKPRDVQKMMEYYHGVLLKKEK